MNLFSPKSGGHPLFLDDFTFIQSAYSEALAGLVSFVSPTGNSILSGIVVDTSGPNVTYTSGFVAIGGEIFKVDAGSFTNSFNPADQLYFLPQQTPVPPSPDTYEDLSLKNVHLQRRAILKYYNSGTDSGGVLYILTLSSQAGEIFDWVPPPGTNVSDFFDSSGLGINSKLGYGLCNGAGSRIDLRGFITAMATNVPNVGSPALSGQLSGITNNIGDKQGIILKPILQANLPNINLPVTDPGHNHSGNAFRDLNKSGGANADVAFSDLGQGSQTYTTPIGHTGITVNTGGSGTGLDVRQPSCYVYKIIKLN